MAVYFNGVASYVGAVLKIESHMWMDGMEEVTAVVWDNEESKIKRIQVGYYGIDGTNLAGGDAVIDATKQIKYAVRKSLKTSAYKEFCKSVTAYKNEIRKGTNAEVVRGRKVAKGTLLNVFWVGEKPTYRSNYYGGYETETIAGCYDGEGRKIWIKAEYLKSIDKIKSPSAKERKRFVNDYVNRNAKLLGA